MILFLNAPQPDRLEPAVVEIFGPERACRIYTDIAKSVYGLIRRIKKIYPVLVYEKTPKFPDLMWLHSDDPGFLEPKIKSSCGERLMDAIKWSFSAGAGKVAVLSVFSPGVSPEIIDKAFDACAERNIAAGQSQDGGIYLFSVGAFYPQIFEGYPWPSKRQFDELSEKAKHLRITVSPLPESYTVKDEQTLQQWTAESRIKI